LCDCADGEVDTEQCTHFTELDHIEVGEVERDESPTAEFFPTLHIELGGEGGAA